MARFRRRLQICIRDDDDVYQERPLPGEGAATFSAGSGESTEMGTVTVDDASFMIAEFENGALGSIEVSRFAPGRKTTITSKSTAARAASSSIWNA